MGMVEVSGEVFYLLCQHFGANDKLYINHYAAQLIVKTGIEYEHQTSCKQL